MKKLSLIAVLFALSACNMQFPQETNTNTQTETESETVKVDGVEMPALGTEAQRKTMAQYAFQDMQQKVSKKDLIVMHNPNKSDVTGYLADLLKSNGYNLKIESDRSTSIENGRLHVAHVGYESKPDETEIVLFYRNWKIRRNYNTKDDKATLISSTGWENM